MGRDTDISILDRFALFNADSCAHIVSSPAQHIANSLYLLIRYQFVIASRDKQWNVTPDIMNSLCCHCIAVFNNGINILNTRTSSQDVVVLLQQNNSMLFCSPTLEWRCVTTHKYWHSIFSQLIHLPTVIWHFWNYYDLNTVLYLHKHCIANSNMDIFYSRIQNLLPCRVSCSKF